MASFRAALAALLIETVSVGAAVACGFGCADGGAEFAAGAAGCASGELVTGVIIRDLLK